MFAFLPAATSLLGDYVDTFATFPEQASSFAADIDWLYWFISIVCILFFVPIAGCLFYFTVKYHKPKGAKAESNVTHHTPLELAWSILPSFVLIAMFIYGAEAYLDIRTIPDGANEIQVKAQKWSWAMDYGNGTIHPELHILVNEPTKLTMQSSDVLHSLYVPAFRAKRDVVPGRYNYMWFKPTIANKNLGPEAVAKGKEWQKSPEGQAWEKKTGLSWNYDQHQITPDGYEFYDLYCAEYCGKDHSIMQTVVVVHETLDDLNAWIKANSIRPDDESPESYGRKLYERRGCGGCHSLDGSKRVGPSFKDLFGSKHGLVAGGEVAVDENYVRESIVYPKAKVAAGYAPVMPSFKGQLSDDDLHCLVEFMKSISEKTPKPKPKQADAKPAETDAAGDQPDESAESSDAATPQESAAGDDAAEQN